MKRRVAITGMGIVSAVGSGVGKFWGSLVGGASGVRRISRYSAAGLPVQIAAEVRDLDFRDLKSDQYEFSETLSTNFDLRTKFAIAAAGQALAEARLDEDRLANANLYLGSGEGQNVVELLSRLLVPCLSDGNSCDQAKLLSFCGTSAAAEFALHDQFMEATIPASVLAALYGICGEVKTSLTACAASAQAIGEATRDIQNGECDIVIAGGTHSMTAPLDILGFAMLSALSKRNEEPERASRPFDRNRDGFVLGEGAGIVVLEDLERAKRRGANIHAEIIGYGASSDAYRVTDMHPEALGAMAAIESALGDAEIERKDVGYINAHGTSTLENDRAETLALHKVFGKFAPEIPVSSIKSMTGHAVAAAGVIETIATVKALREQVVPPTINLETPDPECDLDYVPNHARARTFDVALSNSFGFGGQNVALLVRRTDA